MAETTSAHTEVPGGKEIFPPFQKDTFASQLFWLTLTFVALYLVLAKVALPRIAAIFEARRGRIGDDLAAAEKLREESEAAMAGYEKALAEARGRAQKIANETREKLNAESEERRKALEAKLNAEIAAAESAIAATKSAAMANVRGIAAEVAGAIVERLTGAQPAEGALKAAIEDAVKR